MRALGAQRGGISAEYVALLALVLAIIAAIPYGDIRAAIKYEAEDPICAVATDRDLEGGCRGDGERSSTAARDGGAADRPPAEARALGRAGAEGAGDPPDDAIAALVAQPADEREEEADRREVRELARNLCGAYGSGLDSASILGPAAKAAADVKRLAENTLGARCLGDRASTGYKAIEIAAMLVPPGRGLLKAGAERAIRAAGPRLRSLSRRLAGERSVRADKFDDAPKSKALRPVGSVLQSPNDALANPSLLAGKGPLEVERTVAGAPGWRVERLGRGSRKGQGWQLREYTDAGNPTGSYIRWHPGRGHHGPDPYWRVGSSRWGRSEEIR